MSEVYIRLMNFLSKPARLLLPMEKGAVLVSFILLALIGGCSGAVAPDTSVIEDEAPPFSQPEKLRLSDDGQSLEIPLHALPELEAYLEAYLELYQGEERAKELARIQARFVYTDQDHSRFFVVMSGCGNKLCDLSLVKESDGRLQTRFLMEAAMFSGIEPSPDRSKLLFQFGRNEGEQVIRHSLLVLDSADLSSVARKENRESSDDVDLFDSQFRWPVVHLSWKDEVTLEVSIPDVATSAYEDILTWKSSDGPIRTIHIEF
ncbi:hypothetical protein NDK47_02935 [Brevibacillus ruminantium]|uniref:Lipoprotein n=1 Tax=Brevibacillus ruminantium TaxID=2950604 RepID=A0ABY4WLQ7_9BACL|nr:hypothetical protein [Brevibacillus ruminantium]USG66304.1 hypothetical protein NDK47_02935 [Brevibacillus ruminantium]